jgi:hypothetical protein
MARHTGCPAPQLKASAIAGRMARKGQDMEDDSARMALLVSDKSWSMKGSSTSGISKHPDAECLTF